MLGWYSQNEVTVTKQRCSGFIQARQKLDAVLRTFATVRFPVMRGGGGKPYRNKVSSRPSRPLRTTGTIWSGKTAGNGGRFPMRSTMTWIASRAAAWFVITLSKLHTVGECAALVSKRLCQSPCQCGPLFSNMPGVTWNYAVWDTRSL